MIILAIDTSFDDTAVAVVANTTILSNVLATDLSLHLQYGGIVPRLAKQSHVDHIDEVIALALKRARVTWNDIDRIAVTQGPGLSICLEVGIATAKVLAVQHHKPLVAVNHLEGHLLSFLATQNSAKKMQRIQKPIESYFPLLGVILSGGNTQFVYAPKVGTYEIIGRTLDDAMGEAYDKIGRMLGLGYPAGPFLEKIARTGISGEVVFPVPMRQIKSADMSFSGLKTAASRIIQKYPTLSKQDIGNIALGFQTAAIQHLTEKLEKAIEGKNIKTLVAGGGVIKNLEVRKAIRAFGKTHTLPVHFPYSGKLCTDNAAMIGIAAQYHLPTDENFDRKPIMRLDD